MRIAFGDPSSLGHEALLRVPPHKLQSNLGKWFGHPLSKPRLFSPIRQLDLWRWQLENRRAAHGVAGSTRVVRPRRPHTVVWPRVADSGNKPIVRSWHWITAAWLEWHSLSTRSGLVRVLS